MTSPCVKWATRPSSPGVHGEAQRRQALSTPLRPHGGPWSPGLQATEAAGLSSTCSPSPSPGRTPGRVTVSPLCLGPEALPHPVPSHQGREFCSPELPGRSAPSCPSGSCTVNKSSLEMNIIGILVPAGGPTRGRADPASSSPHGAGEGAIALRTHLTTELAAHSRGHHGRFLAGDSLPTQAWWAFSLARPPACAEPGPAPMVPSGPG